MNHERLHVYVGPRRKRRPGGHYPKWPYRYKLPGQSWVHGTGAFTEAATRQLVDGLIQEHLMRLKMIQRGIGEPNGGAIQKHVRDYLKWGELEGGKGGLPWSKEHYEHRKSQLNGWVKTLGLKTLSDVHYDAFATVNTERLACGMAPNTVNHHAWALAAFMNWCHERNRVTTNCLIRFSSLDKRPRQERGAFTALEFQDLLRAAAPERRLVYRMAAFTGLRRSALASLRIKNVDWQEGLVRLHWEAVKNRKTTVKPVPIRLLEDLKVACSVKEPDSLLLDFSPRHAARDIHRDMHNAGISIMKEGRRRDFHSLKASLGTLLDDFGTPPEITQKALDHSSFRQTQAYIKRDVEPLRAVVNDLENRLLPGDIFHTRKGNPLEEPYLQGCEKRFSSPSHSDRVPGLLFALS